MAIERRKIGSKKKTRESQPLSRSPSSEENTVDSVFADSGDNEGQIELAEGEEKPLEVAEEPEVVVAPEGQNWRIAADIVNGFRPVPRLLWTMIHGVYGRAGEIGSPEALSFSTISPLMYRAALDKTLGRVESDPPPSRRSLEEAVQILGSDVAGSVCFVHSVCRRVSKALAERVSRPILDDALLRAHIGFFVGKLSPECGPGSGMLAGFAGRCGLAIQIAWGNEMQGQKALTGMASGENMSEVCAKVYGCDPLEVAALALIAGGCSRDIAFGISAYNVRNKQIVPGTEQYRWLALFSIIEKLRMGRGEEVTEENWKELGYDTTSRADLNQTIDTIQRRGHGWSWLTQPQL